jgi:hypothetical protein
MEQLHLEGVSYDRQSQNCAFLAGPEVPMVPRACHRLSHSDWEDHVGTMWISCEYHGNIGVGIYHGNIGFGIFGIFGIGPSLNS